METFDARLHSFGKPKSKSSSKWPHPDTFVANPTSLAEAGFFFKPSKDDPDNVQCFLCKKQLGGWDEEDNPFEIHVKKCPKCPWAIARCSLEFDVDPDGHFSITDDSRRPTNKILEKARADTFGGKKWWPHDAAKNHGATSKKMAKAGFVYTPQAQGDDTATCFYCNLSLSGWDAEDDPNEEHIKRVERSGKPCPFFETTERPNSQASSRSNKTNSRKSKAPKVDVTTNVENDVITIKASTTKKRKQKQPDPKQPMKPLSTISDAEDTEDLEEDDDPSLKVQRATAPRKTARKTVPRSKPDSKSTGRGRARESIPSEDADEIAIEVPKKTTRSRTKSGKSSEKNQEKEDAEEKVKDSDKPPSNVDGKVTKSYQDFVIDVKTDEEINGRSKTRDGRKSRGTSRSRSRSKSRARSTNAPSVIDPKSKPLLRASSRSRISGLTEMEEMETERMLAVTPSESEAEPEAEPTKESRAKPSSSARRKINTRGQVQLNMDDDAGEETPRPPSRTASVTADKLTGETNGTQSQPQPDPPSLPKTPEGQITRQDLPKGNPDAADLHAIFQVPQSPANFFIPPLANTPVQVIAALTEEERAMTVEQWIRHEMTVQYQRLKEDGERRIRVFLEQAEETRRRIEAL